MSEPFVEGCPDDRVLMLLLLGLVEEEEAARLEEHVRTCPRCGPRREALLPAGESASTARGWTGHVPPGVLARWPRVAGSLGEFAGVAVEVHLAQCPECSEDLARLQRLRESPVGPPHLLEDLSAELFGQVQKGEGKEPGPRVSERPLRESAPPAPAPAARSSRRGTLILGGYAVLATAAAMVLALRGPLVKEGPSPPGGRPAVGLAAPVPERLPPAVSSPSPWELHLLPPDPRRVPATRIGETSPTPSVDRSEDRSALVVRLDAPAAIAAGSAITLELRDSSRRVLVRTTARGVDLEGGGVVLVTRGGPELPLGHYVLRLRARRHQRHARIGTDLRLSLQRDRERVGATSPC